MRVNILNKKYVEGDPNGKKSFRPSIISFPYDMTPESDSSMMRIFFSGDYIYYMENPFNSVFLITATSAHGCHLICKNYVDHMIHIFTILNNGQRVWNRLHFTKEETIYDLDTFSMVTHPANELTPEQLIQSIDF